MNSPDLIQTIILKCETEIANGHAHPAQAGTLADEILALIDKAGAETAVLPREFGAGFARFKFDRPIVCLDLETSSAEMDKAAIIEFAGVKIWPDGTRESLEMLVDPGFQVTPEIEELTGISNAELIRAQPFGSHALEIITFIRDCYVTGYNIRNFDAPLLSEHLASAGHAWKIKQSEILDSMEIFFKMEPRNLTGAVLKYTGRDHEGAHRAMPDVEATLGVLDGQLAIYQGLPDDIDTLIQVTKKDDRLDLSGNIILIDGKACFGFGKHKGKPCASNLNYCKWMIDQRTFPRNTMDIIEAIYRHA